MRTPPRAAGIRTSASAVRISPGSTQCAPICPASCRFPGSMSLTSRLGTGAGELAGEVHRPRCRVQLIASRRPREVRAAMHVRAQTARSAAATPVAVCGEESPLPPCSGGWQNTCAVRSPMMTMSAGAGADVRAGRVAAVQGRDNVSHVAQRLGAPRARRARSPGRHEPPPSCRRRWQGRPPRSLRVMPAASRSASSRPSRQSGILPHPAAADRLAQSGWSESATITGRPDRGPVRTTISSCSKPGIRSST